MLETPDDLNRLQAMVDHSIEAAGPFLRSSFQMPERSLSAHQLARHLRGLITVAFSSVTSRGAPRVAPVGALFYRGDFWVPSVEGAARTRMLRANPAASLTYFEGNDLAVIVHGRVKVVGPDQDVFQKLEAILEQYGGQSPRSWGRGVFLHLVGERLYTYVQDFGLLADQIEVEGPG